MFQGRARLPFQGGGGGAPLLDDSSFQKVVPVTSSSDICTCDVIITVTKIVCHQEGTQYSIIIINFFKIKDENFTNV